MNNNDTTNKTTFSELAEAVRLREGIDGISRALWLLCSRKVPSTRDWSQELHIPVPVLAALRRELEKRNILEPGKGLRLTEEGKHWLDQQFGAHEIPTSKCQVCKVKNHILPPEMMPLLEEFEDVCFDRPEADVKLDQSHATPKTGIKKALYLLENGYLGQSLFFLGDDDLISIASLLLRDEFLNHKHDLGEICVSDIDERYIDLITVLSEDSISTIKYDAKNELPEELHEQFNVALTDPAYTVNGITTFAYRCVQALKPDGLLLLSMPMMDPKSLNIIQGNLIRSGMALKEIIPDFNEYIGASIHAHVTSLFIWQKTATTQEKPENLGYTPFYTREQRMMNAQETDQK